MCGVQNRVNRQIDFFGHKGLLEMVKLCSIFHAMHIGQHMKTSSSSNITSILYYTAIIFDISIVWNIFNTVHMTFWELVLVSSTHNGFHHIYRFLFSFLVWIPILRADYPSLVVGYKISIQRCLSVITTSQSPEGENVANSQNIIYWVFTMDNITAV
jgi:hypothetical protein